MLSGNAIKQAIADHQEYLQRRELWDPDYCSRADNAQLATLKAAPRVVIDPFHSDRLNPNSYNLRLADKLLVYDRLPGVNYRGKTGYEYNQDIAKVTRQYTRNRYAQVHPEPIELAEWDNVLDMAKENPTYELTIPPEGLVLVPGRLYLGSTMEHTESYNVVPCIEGRSSVARLGLVTHLSAGWGDESFQGDWVLELSVVEPLRVYAGIEVCQVSYTPLIGEISNYKGKYQGQKGPVASRMWKDFPEATTP